MAPPNKANASAVVAGYLGQRHFSLMLGIALVFHMLVFALWVAVPHATVIDIPVRVLNIKLGDGDENTTANAPEEFSQPVASVNTTSVEATLSRSLDKRSAPPRQVEAQHMLDHAVTVKDKSPFEKLPAPIAANNPEPSPSVSAVSSLERAARQFVRERKTDAAGMAALTPSAAGQANASAGSVIGNSSTSDAEVLKRYEQMISSWIQRFKVYPEEARRQNMQGEGMVRIRIDRRGNIQYRIIERRTGSQLLDRAILDMVQRANPVPPVPDNYPRKGDVLEFLVPVSFKLQ